MRTSTSPCRKPSRPLLSSPVKKPTRRPSAVMASRSGPWTAFQVMGVDQCLPPPSRRMIGSRTRVRICPAQAGPARPSARISSIASARSIGTPLCSSSASYFGTQHVPAKNQPLMQTSMQFATVGRVSRSGCSRPLTISTGPAFLEIVDDGCRGHPGYRADVAARCRDRDQRGHDPLAPGEILCRRCSVKSISSTTIKSTVSAWQSAAPSPPNLPAETSRSCTTVAVPRRAAEACASPASADQSGANDLFRQRCRENSRESRHANRQRHCSDNTPPSAPHLLRGSRARRKAFYPRRCLTSFPHAVDDTRAAVSRCVSSAARSLPLR